MARSRFRWQFVALLAVFALIAAACGGDDDTTDTTAAPTETTAAPTETTAAPTETTAAPTETTAAPTETTAAAVEVPTELAGLAVVDDRTFTVELSTPDPEFPLTLAYVAYFPLPQAFFADPAAFEEAPIGNGPFMMDGVWEHDVQIPTVAYADYAGSDAPQVDSLTFTIIADNNTAYNEALGGNLDVMDTVPPDFIPTAPNDFGDRFKESPTSSFNYLGFPAYLPEFTKEHRQALSRAIDRATITEVIFSNGREPAFSAIPPTLAGARETVCDNWTYDPEGAAALWEAAGPIESMTIWFNSGAGHDAWVEAVVNQWNQVLGIDPASIAFEQLEFSEYLPVLDNAEVTGPFRLGWGQDYPSPLNFLEPLYASYNIPPVGSNNTNYVNPDFDALIADGKAAVAEQGTLEAGIPFYQQAEDLLCEDVPIAPMFYGKNQFVHSEDVDNVFIDSYSDLGYTKVTSQDGNVTTWVTEPEHLAPTNSNESEGVAVLRALFSPLVQYDPETNEPFNLVAESIETTDGGQTYTVTIGEGWTFHDGSPVTAQSFVDAWNYGALGSNAQQNNSFYSNIVGYAEMNPDTGE